MTISSAHRFVPILCLCYERMVVRNINMTETFIMLSIVKIRTGLLHYNMKSLWSVFLGIKFQSQTKENVKNNRSSQEYAEDENSKSTRLRV